MEFTLTQIQWMGREVKRQGDGPEYVAGMAQGVEYAARGIRDRGDIHLINHAVTLEKTRYGYRRTPVTFANGGSACNAAIIVDAMDKWWLNRPTLDFRLDELNTVLDEWIKHFLYIHPYEDGNGRTATIIRNAALFSLNSPQDLPDYNW